MFVAELGQGCLVYFYYYFIAVGLAAYFVDVISEGIERTVGEVLLAYLPAQRLAVELQYDALDLSLTLAVHRLFYQTIISYLL